MTLTLKKLLKQYPNTQAHEVYVINGRILLTAKTLEQVFGVSDRMVREYVERGMPYSDMSIKGAGGVNLFELHIVTDWHRRNIKPKDPSAGGEEGLAKEAQEATLRKIIDDSRKAAAQADRAELAAQKERGEVIPKSEIEKILVSWAHLLVGAFKRAYKNLPKELAHKDSSTISSAMERYFKDEIATIQKTVKEDV